MDSLRKLLRVGLVAIACALSSGTIKAADGLFKPDPAVRVGHLDNGLTYYIRHHEEPQGRACFYIAQKVGAIQEKPEQRGLAHFLEHMCFNGTTHFPGNGLREYLETIGVKFGADLNAYTAVDETVYNIDNVPVKVEGAIDSCLMILHDWSNDLTLDPEEINKERGVIREEWRSRNSAQQRMNERMMPVLMGNSKYADCMPIGSMDVVMNFDPQVLRDYYETWYRPDLQGVIVVGDINVDEVESKIKKIFADIPAPDKDAPVREYYPVPDNDDFIYFAGADKEITSPTVVIYFKHPATERDSMNTRRAQIETLYQNFFYNMFHDHTRDIAQKPGAPFSICYIRDGGFFLSQTMRAVTAIVSCHSTPDGIEKGTEAMLRELMRVYKHGFTQSEFDRYRQDFLSGLDNLVKNKDKRQSGRLVQEYVRNFLDNAPYAEVEDEVAFWKETIPQLTLDDFNAYFRSLFSLDGHNVAITVTGPENDSVTMPSRDEMISLFKRVVAEDVEPYVDYVNPLPFLPQEPVAGKIVKEETDSVGLIHWDLSNGLNVIIRPSDFKKDEVLVQSMSHGGYSLFPADMYRWASFLSMMGGVAGLGNWNLADMQKGFTGSTAHINAGVAEDYQSIAGSCDAKDIADLFKQMHAAFLYPNKDVDAFQALADRLKRNTRESKHKPNTAYADSLRVTLYGDNPFAKNLEPEDYDNVPYDRLLDLYRKSFSDASNTTVTIIGDVEIDSLRPYVELYLASLPSTYEHAVGRPVLEVKPGSRTCIFEKEQETPTASIYMRYATPSKFTRRSQTVASMLGQALTMLYTQTIREDAGLAYSVRSGAQQNFFPKEEVTVTVRFPTNPKSMDEAIRLVDEGINRMATEGPSAAEIDKVKEYLIKVCESNRSVNKYWQYVMSYNWNHPGEDLDNGYIEMVRSITPDDVKEMAREILNGDRIVVVMTSPEK